jgi:predicted ATP-grasp superfamily ATP-dependent carboligase
MKKKIIVFPASRWQIDLIKFLKKKNYYVYSLDDDNLALGHTYSNKRLNIDSKKISEIRKFIKRNKCNILSCCSDLGLKLINKIYYKKNNYFNKYKQRLIQKDNGINTPKFFKPIQFNYKKFLSCNKKVIIKPISGSGSNNVEYYEKFPKIFKGKKIIEEFIDGKEFNVDGYFNDQKTIIYAIMEKKKIKKSKTVSYIMKQNSLAKKIIKKIDRILSIFLRSSKYPNGPFHAEIIINKKNNEPYIVEAHPREAGFDLFYLTCKKITGLNLYQNLLDTRLHGKVNEKNLISKNVYKNFCCRMIPININGKIKNIFFKRINKNKNLKIYFRTFFKKNQNISIKSNDSSRLGFIQCFSNNKVDLEKYSLKLKKKYFKLELHRS